MTASTPRDGKLRPGQVAALLQQTVIRSTAPGHNSRYGNC
jgi:hypothetical protein